MGRIPSSLALVELPFWAVVSETEGRNRLIRNLVNAGIMAAYHRAGLPMEGLANENPVKKSCCVRSPVNTCMLPLVLPMQDPRSAGNENPVKTFALMPRPAHSPYGGGWGLPGGSTLLPVSSEE